MACRLVWPSTLNVSHDVINAHSLGTDALQIHFHLFPGLNRIFFKVNLSPNLVGFNFVPSRRIAIPTFKILKVLF